MSDREITLHGVDIEFDPDNEVCFDLNSRESGFFYLTTAEAIELKEFLTRILECITDADPTPWCTACGAMRIENCHCGPIADND